ncbi:protein-L-isoaspartate(D-aspartate) O-methyltransferase [Rhizobium sp. BK650]|uniref:protein-L-isoaspartate O-methyltransferase family protein n=1 Tax=Rhizobium sp. BK650 TaxID=2586990 RepID=UPI00161F8602|nr:methyltransferase domain-containing protein [Rhizobium sp. BK650]MBB3657386.1 protein-L-isoaspartate(D-aspartate) O-methyltransferase [Rhizobium sp. BK650]
MGEKELVICRQAYATQMLTKMGIVGDERLRKVFATVPREDFLDPPPWRMANGFGYQDMPSTDPVILYQDVLIALQEGRQVNNGSPSLHALGLHWLAPKPGETVCHIGAGGGYYTAMLSHLVGSDGHVVAIEYDRNLALRAAANLAPYGNVEVICGNGLEWPRSPADAVYVNFAVHRPAEAWIDNLAAGGRLIFPLSAPSRDGNGNLRPLSARGGFFLIECIPDGYRARYLSPTIFVWGHGATGTLETYKALDDTFRHGGMNEVTRLRWKTPRQGDEWYSEEDWGLF